MTTAELIERLEKADPSGKLPVCIDNKQVMAVYTSPAYWDGRLQVIEFDGQTPKKIRFETAGTKVSIEAYDIETLALDYPEIEVDYSNLHPVQVELIKAGIEESRRIARGEDE